MLLFNAIIERVSNLQMLKLTPPLRCFWARNLDSISASERDSISASENMHVGGFCWRSNR